jgi:hypothetical protein
MLSGLWRRWRGICIGWECSGQGEQRKGEKMVKRRDLGVKTRILEFAEDVWSLGVVLRYYFLSGYKSGEWVVGDCACSVRLSVSRGGDSEFYM